MPQTYEKMSRTVTQQMELNYLLYLPKEYRKEQGKKWPLILFLHGAGERGDNLELVKIHGIPARLEKGDEFPFIIVSPQCPKGSYWPLQCDRLLTLLDDIIAQHSVDEQRVYIAGLSMGGMGTWHMACSYPERFAAAVPVCGGGIPHLARFMKNVPVWAFHGDRDSVVPLYKSEEMVEALRKAGGEAKLTIYPDTDHDSWIEAFNNDELYSWLLLHSRQTEDRNEH